MNVELEENLSKLTTMITPFGCFRWCRLPYGLNVSSEIFRRRLIKNLENLPGIACMADDIIVAGCGESKEESDQNLDESIKKPQKRCQERQIRLNDEKTELTSHQNNFIFFT